jgi:predicted small metal-binding protein
MSRKHREPTDTSENRPSLAPQGSLQFDSGPRHYDGCVKQIPCVCGYVVKGEDDDELWQNAQEHMREDHPDLAGKVSREDLLAQAEEVPQPKS